MAFVLVVGFFFSVETSASLDWMALLQLSDIPKSLCLHTMP